MDVITLGVAKNYVDETIKGLGTVKEYTKLLDMHNLNDDTNFALGASLDDYSALLFSMFADFKGVIVQLGNTTIPVGAFSVNDGFIIIRNPEDDVLSVITIFYNGDDEFSIEALQGVAATYVTVYGIK